MREDLTRYPPDSEQQQAAVLAIADNDGFNWGYDPVSSGRQVQCSRVMAGAVLLLERCCHAADASKAQEASHAAPCLVCCVDSIHQVHYGVPEGSYATEPDGAPRIREFREMVTALHAQVSEREKNICQV